MKYKYDIYIYKINPSDDGTYESVHCIFPNISDTYDEAVRKAEAKKEETLKVFREMLDWDEKWVNRFDIRITAVQEMYSMR